MLKAQAWPGLPYVSRWQADARSFRRQARRKYHPSMRRKIDLAQLYADALVGLPDKMDDQAPLPIPEVCPMTLEQMLGEESCGQGLYALALLSAGGCPGHPNHGVLPRWAGTVN
jgi:Domain of unknown function DUF29